MLDLIDMRANIACRRSLKAIDACLCLGANGFDRASRRKRGVPRLSGGLVKHLTKP